jgi:type IV secretory pathway protease TraF
MMITRGEKEWYRACLQNDDHSHQVPFFYSMSDHHPVRTPGTILLLHEWSSSCKDARYHSFTSRQIIILLGRQVLFFYSTSDHHSVRMPGTIIFIHEWSSSCKDSRYYTWCPYRMMITRRVKEWYLASLQDDDHSWSNRMVPGVLTGRWVLVE